MRKQQSGFTLVEVLVATGIVILTLVGISSGVTFAVKNSRFSQEKAVSIRHAQEGIEWFRAQRDTLGWQAFYDLATQGGTSEVTYCMDEFPQGEPENFVLKSVNQGEGCETISDTQYVRYVHMNIVTNEHVDIQSHVVWGDGSQAYNTTLNNTLTRWR